MIIEIAAEQAPAVGNGIVYLLGAILGGGAITGAASWFRLKKQGEVEKEEIISRAAEQAVNALRLSLIRLETELDQAKAERDRIEHLLTSALADRGRLESQIKELNRKILNLERDISQYRSLVSHSNRSLEESQIPT